MDYEAQLKLQAFLDGELPEGEAQQGGRVAGPGPRGGGLAGGVAQYPRRPGGV